MKIRTQNLLTIVPIFIVLAAITGALSYTTQKQELLWGMRECVSSIATTTAEFIDGDAYPEWRDKGIRTRPGLEFDVAVNRIMKWNQADRLYGLTADGRMLTFTTGDTAALLWHIPVFKEIQKTITGDTLNEIYISGIIRADSVRHVMAAFAPVKNNSGEITGYLAAEIDAAGYLAQLEDVTRETYLIAAGIILIGLITAGTLSRYLTRRITQLTHASRVVGAGQYEYEVNIRSPRELKDLSNTFNTMSSVMKDVLHKTKRSLLEEEHFKKESDLAMTCEESTPRSVERESGGWQLAGCVFTAHSHHEFIGSLDTPDAFFVWMGSVKPGEPLPSVRQKAALRTFLERMLVQTELPEAVRLAQELFDPEELHVVKMQNGSSVIEKCSAVNVRITFEKPEIQAHAPYTIHTVDEASMKTITSYGKQLSHLPLKDLVSDLQRILSGRTDGGLLLIQTHRP